MSTDYAGDPTVFPASIPIPDDGDKDDAASFDVGMEGLADRTMALAQGEMYALINQPFLNTSSRFTADYSATGGVDIYGWLQSSVADVGGLVFQVPLPKIGMINGIYALVHGNAGGGAAHAELPGTNGTAPNLSYRLYVMDDSIDSYLALEASGNWDDPSTSVSGPGTPIYESWHLIGGALGTPQPCRGMALWLKLTGEAGQDALANYFKLGGLILDIGAETS